MACFASVCAFLPVMNQLSNHFQTTLSPIDDGPPGLWLEDEQPTWQQRTDIHRKQKGTQKLTRLKRTRLKASLSAYYPAIYPSHLAWYVNIL